VGEGLLPDIDLPEWNLEPPKSRRHGDYATNLAFLLAPAAKKNPRQVAELLVAHLPASPGRIERVEIAGPGFINVFVADALRAEALGVILAEGGAYGRSEAGQGRRVQVEFVSANPTGPVHIGNARGGPLGDAIASLLEATGYAVIREFYLNDVGGQIDKLGRSIRHSLLDKPASAEKIEYEGSYVDELAAKAASRLAGKIPEDVTEAERVLGRFGIDELTREIRQDCEDMGIRFDSWISEKQTLAMETQPVLDGLKAKGVTLEKEGAVWLATNDEFLQDRECVLVRSDSRPTYFANDIAYHVGKYRRGFDRIINVWGSNHHGHVPRVKAAVKSLGFDPDRIETVLYQYVRVKRGTEAVKMSKRAGNFVTAREVLDEAGRDAFRFLLLLRAPESHLDFDLKIATEKSAENPVYYVQYAHARLCSIERKAAESRIPLPDESADLSLLTLPEEIEMIRMIHEYPEEVARAAERLEPHRITFYLLELVKAFQAYYTRAKEDPRYRVLSAQVDTSQAKLYLCRALKLAISQGLTLLGVSAPEVMVQEDQGD
jgi:arginyl-tRNA synthetase